MNGPDTIPLEIAERAEPAGPGHYEPPGEPAAASAAPKPTIDVFEAAALQGERIPARAWHVPELLPANEITMLSGDGGVGKSLLALQLAVATATGTEWIGTAPRLGRALFVSAEDDRAELHRRLANILRGLNMDFDALANLSLISLAGRDAVLALPAGREGALAPTPLFAALRAVIAERRPDLLVLDTLADLFGGDEIRRAHARQFIGMLRGLALDFDLTVLLLSHPSQSGLASGAGTSGSTAWSNSVRSRLYFERLQNSEDGAGPDPDARVLSTKKSNYGRVGDERVVRWRDGAFQIDAGARADQAELAAEAERVFLEMLASFARQGRDVSPARSPNFAPRVFAGLPAAKGIGGRQLAAAMERLLDAGRIRAETFGPPSKQRTRLVMGPTGGER